MRAFQENLEKQYNFDVFIWPHNSEMQSDSYYLMLTILQFWSMLWWIRNHKSWIYTCITLEMSFYQTPDFNILSNDCVFTPKSHVHLNKHFSATIFIYYIQMIVAKINHGYSNFYSIYVKLYNLHRCWDLSAST